MPEVQSIGVNDYNQQYPTPYATNEEQMPEQYESYPAYMPEEPRRSSSLGFWLGTALGIAAGVGGYFIGKNRGANGCENIKKELKDLKASEAVKNYDSVKKDFDELKGAVEELVKEANETSYTLYKPWTWGKKGTQKFSIKKIREKFEKFINKEAKAETAEKAENEAATEAKKAEDSAKD